jgi:hypothetical protein
VGIVVVSILGNTRYLLFGFFGLLSVLLFGRPEAAAFNSAFNTEKC